MAEWRCGRFAELDRLIAEADPERRPRLEPRKAHRGRPFGARSRPREVRLAEGCARMRRKVEHRAYYQRRMQRQTRENL